MLSSFITSNKSRSLIYRYILERLKELASLKVLNHKYDDKNSSLQIDFWEYYFKWTIHKEKDVDNNHGFWKFILTKIWSNLYD